LIGRFENRGRRWRRKGEAEGVNVHDFPSQGVGKAIPYGTFDVTRDEAVVNVGITHETAEFAVESIRRWWQLLGRKAYPQARRLLICADAGGSNGTRPRAWKVHVQALADRLGMAVTVCHYPPGTSKVGVGTAIARDPLLRSGRAQLAHPAPTSGESAKARERRWLTDTGRRKPASDVPSHATPRKAMPLTATSQGLPPQAAYRHAKTTDRPSIHGHTIILEVPCQD
jgi:hypothetical protein